MSDFFIDFSHKLTNRKEYIIGSMKYYDDIVVRTFEHEKFILYLSCADNWDVWAAYKSIDGNIFIALSGRIALDSRAWEEAKEIPGEGGLACKAICKIYKSGGLGALENLNGNYVAFVLDESTQKLYVITDRCGMFPCFGHDSPRHGLILSSHPDILANALHISNDYDLTSVAEFLVTGKVSFPHSYYTGIRALDYGSIYTIDLKPQTPTYETKRKYFDFKFKIDHGLSEWDVAEELAAAFRNAINRRTLPLFGTTGISLSGGLDSRALLCSADNRDNIWTFCFFDEENLEYRIAKEIAKEANVKFIPLKRDFDHYGDNAEMGVRISGGMGDFGNNHYLGFRNAFKNIGIDNIIAGFYCDYLFKSLVLNKNRNKFLRTETYAKFEYENYMPLYWFDTLYSKQVKERLDEQFPDNLKKDESDLGRLEIERRRLFPFYLEPDNQETTIPQRVMGWYLPIVDNDIIDTYLKIPPKFKLNTSMYSKMVEIRCGEKISKIKNINTGARVNAPQMSLILHGYKNILHSRIKKKKKSIATNESWPNWPYYIYNSKKIESLWMRKNETACDIFSKILGSDPYGKPIREYKSVDLKLFLRLLTLKLWFDQRM
jgi:asparagine synthase (glutamine-hydrolysing)